MTPWMDERRRHPRVALEWPAVVRRSGDHAPVEATTVNLSCGGIYFLAADAFRAGERLDLMLVLPPDLDPSGRLLRLECSVSVVRIEPAAARPGYGVACQIQDYQVLVGQQEGLAEQRPRDARPAGMRDLAEAS